MKKVLPYIWNTKWALTVTAGLLLGASFPPIPFPILIFPAFLLIFRIIDLCRSARQAAYWTYPAFLIWNIFTTYWLTMATAAGGVAAILANAAVMTVPVMLQYRVQQSRLKPWLIALLQAACWISYEFLHHQWDLAWPWLTLGNAWSNVPQAVQYISITGYWGISLWVLFSCALAYQTVKYSKRSLLLASGLVFTIFPVFSLSQLLLSVPASSTPSHEVVVAQPNFDSYETYGGYSSPLKANDRLLALTDSLRTPETDLVVWPENAIQADISNHNSYSDVATDTKMLLGNRAEEWDATIIAGATFLEFYPTGEAPDLPISLGQQSYLPFNAALGFLPEQPMQVYRKHNLVPIVERVPFIHFLNTIDVFAWINWNRIQGYGKGEMANQFDVQNTKTPALVCYDSVFPGWVKKFVQDGAGYLTIITNDGWWGNTSGHEQHFAYARLRAIEFHRWVIRSANNGISGIIAPDGSVKIKTPYWKSTAFRYEVPVLTAQTFYARFGDWVPVGMLVLSISGLVYIYYREKYAGAERLKKSRV